MRTLGIIVCTVRRSPPFLEAGFFKRLALEGRRLGIGLLIFSPKHVDWNRRRVKGWTYSPEENRWVAGEHPLPTLVYDRCFYTDSSQFRDYKPFVQRLDQSPHVQLLGRGLVGKWDTHLILSRNPSLLPYLPETQKWEGPDKALLFIGSTRKNSDQTQRRQPRKRGGSHPADRRGISGARPDPGKPTLSPLL